MSTNINLADMASSQGFTINGGNAGDQSGWSVSDAGDVNNDGFYDIIIGAYNASANSKLGAGITYVIYGGNSLIDINLNSLNLLQGVEIYGANTNDQSGRSVSGAGDVNGDGYDDVIIGAPYASSNEATDAGISYVIFGNRNLTNINLANLSHTQGFAVTGINGNSGYSVSGAGDMNKDGYEDIVIGTGIGSTAFVIFGSSLPSDVYLSSLSLNQGFSITGLSNNGNSLSVSGAGDFNGDKYDDIVIGAWMAAGFAGETYIIYGANVSTNINVMNLSYDQGFVMTGDSSVQSFSGYSVSDAGDLNNDGYSDVIIGCASSSWNGENYVIFGKNFSTNIDLSKLTTNQGFVIGYVGGSVSGARDINYDSYADVIIGNPIENSNKGESYLVYGGASFANINLGNLSNAQGFSVSGAQFGENSGYSVSNAGDMNKDGFADIVIGAPSANSRAGKTYILYGAASGFVTQAPTGQPTEMPTGQPTAMPTSQPTGQPTGHPTSEPTQPRVVEQTINYDVNVLQGMLSTFGSLIGTYIFYKFILNVLDNWGFRYKFLFDKSDTTDNDEIGLYIDESKESNELYAVHKQKHYKIEVNNGINKGISQGLYDFIINSLNKRYKAYFSFSEKIKFVFNEQDENALEAGEYGVKYTPWLYDILPFDLKCLKGRLEILYKENEKDSLSTFKIEMDNAGVNGISRGLYNIIINQYKTMSKSPLLIMEQNQLRDFLVTRERIHYEMEFCMPCYKDLGIARGTTYYIFYDFLKEIRNYHFRNRQEVRISEESALRVKDLLKKTFQEFQGNTRNSLHSQEGDVEMRKEESQSLSEKRLQKGNVLLSIDAMMEPEHVLLQNEEFESFGKNLIAISKELMTPKPSELKPSQSHVITVYNENAAQGNTMLSGTNDLMLSLLSARQIFEYLPLIKHLTECALNHLGYNISLPEVLDSKATLVTTHLVLGNIAAQLLPADLINTGMIVSNIGTGAYGIKLIASDYLKAQQPTDEPLELAVQCGTAMLLYNLPNLATFVAVQALLPGAAYAITGYDILASSSLGAMQCYSNYKAVAQSSEPTTADNVVPYIADAFAAYALSGYFGIDTSSSTALMMSIKNSMSIMAAVVATDSMSRMMMDVVHQEVKADYIDPVLNCVGDLYSCVLETIN